MGYLEALQLPAFRTPSSEAVARETLHFLLHAAGLSADGRLLYPCIHPPSLSFLPSLWLVTSDGSDSQCQRPNVSLTSPLTRLGCGLCLDASRLLKFLRLGFVVTARVFLFLFSDVGGGDSGERFCCLSFFSFFLYFSWGRRREGTMPEDTSVCILFYQIFGGYTFFCDGFLQGNEEYWSFSVRKVEVNEVYEYRCWCVQE